jgi:hypothetical protein
MGEAVSKMVRTCNVCVARVIMIARLLQNNIKYCNTLQCTILQCAGLDYNVLQRLKFFGKHLP